MYGSHPLLVLDRLLAKASRQSTQHSFRAVTKTAVVDTTAYMDVVTMQKTLLLVYLSLPVFLAMLVSEVCPETKHEQGS